MKWVGCRTTWVSAGGTDRDLSEEDTSGRIQDIEWSRLIIAVDHSSKNDHHSQNDLEDYSASSFTNDPWTQKSHGFLADNPVTLIALESVVLSTSNITRQSLWEILLPSENLIWK